ncbi:oxidoreductase [Modestobacter marinus]|uniref:Oxidoreductase n=1 Tax=Modestobacter marinus TaxID=477641 RepID=A0ABQ2FWI7_9ACTN|nr:oxidoreductase [Modestobacter marinus]
MRGVGWCGAAWDPAVGTRTVATVTIPLRPGAGPAARPAARPTGPDPLAPLLELPGVAAAAEDARAAVDRLLGHKVLRRESAGVSAESALRGARASAALEGVDRPLADLRAGEVTDPVVQGALRVSVGLGSMVETWERAPGQVLARLHVLAATGLAEPADLGRPSGAAGPRLGGLFSIITGSTTVPAVVVAGVVHGELAALAPFGVQDGVVARAAARLVGISRGLDRKAVTVPEVGFAELGRDAYEAALEGYRTGGPAGVAGWLVHCCRATAHGATEGLAICESLLRG